MHGTKNKNILIAIGAVVTIGVVSLAYTLTGGGKIFQGYIGQVLPDTEICTMMKSFYNAGVWTGQAEQNFYGLQGGDCINTLGVDWWNSITQIAPTPSQDSCVLAKSYYNAGLWTGMADSQFDFGGADCSNLYGTAFWDSITQTAKYASKDQCDLMKSYYNAGVWTGQADQQFGGLSGGDCVNLYGAAYWDSIHTVAKNPSPELCNTIKTYYNSNVWTGQADQNFYGLSGADCVNLYGSGFWEAIKTKSPTPSSEECELIKSYFNAGLWTGQNEKNYDFNAQVCLDLYGRAYWDSITKKFVPSPTPTPTPTPAPHPAPEPEEPEENVPCDKFTDVSKQSAHYEAIEYVRTKGIFTGYDDCTFRPGSNINRAEFTKTLVNAFNISGDVGTSSHFSDVFSSNWFFDVVEKAFTKKLVNGYPDGTFKPGNLINNAESAKIFANAAKIDVSKYSSDNSYCSNLSAVEKQEWFYPFMASLASKGIISNTCSPEVNTTRADVAEMFYHLNQ